MENKEFTGAMLHGCYKPNADVLAEVGTIDLGNTPEDIVKNEVLPLIKQLADILKEHNVFVWLTYGYMEDTKTDESTDDNSGNA